MGTSTAIRTSESSGQMVLRATPPKCGRKADAVGKSISQRRPKGSKPAIANPSNSKVLPGSGTPLVTRVNVTTEGPVPFGKAVAEVEPFSRMSTSPAKPLAWLVSIGF